ncbi:type I-E CRISPR-associated protein Cse2/CasB [Thiorhodococcus mannitoliphagus]|uniref:Type I-E CRISPR-associated protein Cse2/CasB n=1 Tax=Thiorhodococcus mannitoliphagus TaxID=329406 RepID=A0A6P1E4T0_9GAMM|nr:type I-E CRISPR-associated protein Cse2/CasB [Thiorhodococcus mannitoliphagus]NEX23034.1 type I-E CRISPR-associated protein Cse2/CasB [Thiorhodococcus mannitoliphagus]
MSEAARSFISHLSELAVHDPGALAHLRRSLGFAPGAFPRAYPYVERFVPRDSHADAPWRKALYLTAGLFALHPEHRDGDTLASALGTIARRRESKSIEQRFIALLGAEPDSLPKMLRPAVSLLVADDQPCDFAHLLADLGIWLRPFGADSRDWVRQRWARDFYRAYDLDSDAGDSEPSRPTASSSAD